MIKWTAGTGRHVMKCVLFLPVVLTVDAVVLVFVVVDCVDVVLVVSILPTFATNEH